MKSTFQKIKGKLKKYFSGVRLNLTIFTALAVAMILLSFAIQYAGNYVLSLKEEVRNVQSWDYTYISSPDASVDGTKLTPSNYVVPISSKGNTGYCYLTHTFDKINEKTYLKIITDHSPVKIIVNGQEVYNNHYGSEQYVANSYNLVTLNKTTRSQKVEVYMAVPFSVTFNVQMSNTQPSDFTFTPAFFAGVGVAAVGIIMFLISLVFSIKNKHLSKLVFVAFFDVFSGADIVLWQFLQNSYKLNAPIYYNISLAVSLLVMLWASVSAMSNFGMLSKSCKFTLALSVTFLACSAIPNIPAVLRIVPVAVSAMLFISLILSQSSFIKAIGRRLKGASSVWFLGCYVVLTDFILVLQLFLGKTKYYVVFSVLTSIVYTIVMTIVKYDESSKKFTENKKQKEQFIDSLAWVDSLDSMMKKVNAAFDDEEKLITAAQEFKKIINERIPSENGLTIGVCQLGDDGNFYEIYNDNLDEPCNYNMIDERFLNSSQTHHVLWGNTYFDVIIDKNAKPYAILHFEGADNLLSLNINNIVETISADLDVSLNITDDEIANEEFEAGIFAQLSQTVEIKNGVGKNHLENVSNITFCLCAQLGLSEDEIRQIGYASMLHDIGKIVIPEEIIKKQGYLTEDEKNLMRFHAEAGYKLLSCIPGEFMSLAAEIAYYHHEKYDGTGYYGKKGEDIPLSARIVSVADVFDALTSSRSYKTAWTDERAIEYLKENSGTSFDENVVNAFLDCYQTICEFRKGGDY